MSGQNPLDILPHLNKFFLCSPTDNQFNNFGHQSLSFSSIGNSLVTTSGRSELVNKVYMFHMRKLRILACVLQTTGEARRACFMVNQPEIQFSNLFPLSLELNFPDLLKCPWPVVVRYQQAHTSPLSFCYCFTDFMEKRQQGLEKFMRNVLFHRDIVLRYCTCSSTGTCAWCRGSFVFLKLFGIFENVSDMKHELPASHGPLTKETSKFVCCSGFLVMVSLNGY